MAPFACFYDTDFKISMEPDEKYLFLGENNNEFEAFTMDDKSLVTFNFLEEIRIDFIRDPD